MYLSDKDMVHMTADERQFVAEADEHHFSYGVEDDGHPFALGATDVGDLFSMEVIEADDESSGGSVYWPASSYPKRP